MDFAELVTFNQTNVELKYYDFEQVSQKRIF